MSQEALIAGATANFYAWERRGRGWNTFSNYVELEPIYVPFFPYCPPKRKVIDDADRPNIFKRMASALSEAQKPEVQEESYEDFLSEQYEIAAYTIDGPHALTGFTLKYPREVKIVPETFSQLLIMLSSTRYPVSFEILGAGDVITIQFVSSTEDALHLRLQLSAYCPEAIVREIEVKKYIPDPEAYTEVIEFGLNSEFTLPLKRYDKASGETFKSFFSLLDHVKDGEEVILQVLFQGAVNPWAKSIRESLLADDGECFFMDAPEMLDLAKEKTASPLFAVGIRAFVKAMSHSRCDELCQETISAIGYQSASHTNFLIPMNITADDRFDVFNRVTHRVGMLLNTEELVNFVHFPDPSLVSYKLHKQELKTHPAPKSLVGHEYILGQNRHQDDVLNISLDIPRRLRHIHIIGATGTGKSTLLTNLIGQDMNNGHGLTLIDPHGDLVDAVLGYIPKQRIDDVVVVDVADMEYPIGFNLLEAKSESEKIVLSSDLVTAIRRQSTSWGDQMTAILSNAINAFLESPSGGTIFDLRRFLIDDKFRKEFLKAIPDPSITHFWKTEYAMLRKHAISPILVRLDSFLRPKVVRNMMAQKNGLNFNEIISGNKILLVKLPQGLIGEENSHLLGTLIVSKIQQAAQARQSIKEQDRKPFFLYLDEFQDFITPSMSAILSGSRKYGLGLILAHQEMEQVGKYDSELANSIIANPNTRICFRVGDIDARRLEKGFVHFDGDDLQNLPVGSAIVKVDTSSQNFNLKTFPVFPISGTIPENDLALKNTCIANSRERYGTLRTDVEKYIYSLYDTNASEEISEPSPNVASPKAEEPVPIPEPESSRTPLDIQAKEYIEQEKTRKEVTQHRYLQNLIKKHGESMGFKAVIEEPINNGEGRVDVALLRDNFRIAVEISATNTVINEVQNIVKCLNAGYNLVIMCSDTPRHLANIKGRAIEEIQSSLLARVLFLNPLEVCAYLETYAIKESLGSERVIKGYRVKVRYKEN